MKTLFGAKGKMGQTFIEGFRIPVTKISLGPCVVTQVKTKEKDGYNALQLGFGSKKIKNTTKQLQGHFKAINNSELKINNYPRYIKEVKLEKETDKKVGDLVSVSEIFKKGDVISVTAINKGKGFAGGVRRYNFRGGPKTHGQSDRHRAPGSVGQTTTPGRVYRGKRMAGRMGSEQVTIKNIHVVEVDKEKNEILVSSPIPGRIGIFVTVTKIKAGSLKDLEHEVVATVTEGESDEPKVEESAKEAAVTLEEAKE
jgi:large subunit ribosomal protein L3